MISAINVVLHHRAAGVRFCNTIGEDLFDRAEHKGRPEKTADIYLSFKKTIKPDALVFRRRSAAICP